MQTYKFWICLGMTLTAAAAGCKSSQEAPRTPPTEQAAKPAGPSAKAQASSTPVADNADSNWKRVDLEELDDELFGSIRVPADAKVTGGRGRGLEGLPAITADVVVPGLGLEIIFTTGAGAPDPIANSLEDFLSAQKISKANIVDSSSTREGFILVWRNRDQEYRVYGQYNDMACDVISQGPARTTEQAARLAMRICASFEHESPYPITRSPDVDAEDDEATQPGSGLPPLALDPAPERDARSADDLNEQGLKAHKAKNFARAITLFKNAIAKDPSHINARYNLACAYNLSGDTPSGLAILRELGGARNCPVCQGRLVRAQRDEDWRSAWQDPRFKSVVGGAHVRSMSAERWAREAARQIINADEYEPDLSAVHPRDVIRLKDNGRVREIRGLKQFVDYAEQNLSEMTSAGSVAKCKKSCCAFVPENDDDENQMEGASVLYSLCFRTDSAGVRTVSALDFGGDGIGYDDE